MVQRDPNAGLGVWYSRVRRSLVLHTQSPLVHLQWAQEGLCRKELRYDMQYSEVQQHTCTVFCSVKCLPEEVHKVRLFGDLLSGFISNLFLNHTEDTLVKPFFVLCTDKSVCNHSCAFVLPEGQ